MRKTDPTRLPPLDLLASFEVAARHLSFTRAAAERFVTQSAMSRQMQALEQEIGVPLFVRGHRALQLTEDGRRLLVACTGALEQIRGAVSHIRGRERREVLALTTTTGLASLWLIPRLPEFTRDHPGIDVRIDADMSLRDLARDSIDVAIRYTALAGAEGEALFGETLTPVCSPALLRNGPPLSSPADLALHTLIKQQSPAEIDAGMPVEWTPWLRAMGLPDLEPASLLTFNSYGEAIAAALAGHGVALGRRPLIDNLLSSRQLVTPFKTATASPRGYTLVVAEHAAARPAVRALVSWLIEQARRTSGAPARAKAFID
jgi:LysR family transcriptional regulator, glycine cleavage system transcriptional activator